MKKVQVDTRGIKNRLRTVKPFRAISEYVWNGFDADADKVSINYTCNQLGNIDSISIKDNGSGINRNKLTEKFEPVLISEKGNEDDFEGLVQGKNGLGRLTFYHFAQKAIWSTVYKNGDNNKSYQITVDNGSLDHFSYCDETLADEPTGTKVEFVNINGLNDYNFKIDVIEYLKKEFSWYLELNRELNYEILVNKKPLDYNELICDKDKMSIKIDKYIFNIGFIRWRLRLNKHYSRFYCINSLNKGIYSKPTTLNNKGDSFYHSVFIKSKYFDEFYISKNEDSKQIKIDDNYHSSNDTIFVELFAEINKLLKEKRNPFLKKYGEQLVDDYEKTGIFPKFNKSNRWEKIRAVELRETVKRLYQIEPKIFVNLNNTQKKTFVNFIGLMIDSCEVENLFEILKGVVDLSASDREKLAGQLKLSKLSSIIKTIELISDRYKAVSRLKQLAFDQSMYAQEVPHLQKMMEKNYWLIGEEFQLLTAAEPDFEESLRRYTYILRGEKKKLTIEHENKNKEMDLFMIRQDKKSKYIENVVLELKHPVNVKLGKKEIDQVIDYYNVIKSEPRFNGSNMIWKFFLIGNTFSNDDYIKSLINSLKIWGEPGLVFKSDNHNIYAKTWSEIFTEFEIRHNFLDEKLKLERERLLADKHWDADQIINATLSSDSPGQMSV